MKGYWYCGYYLNVNKMNLYSVWKKWCLSEIRTRNLWVKGGEVIHSATAVGVVIFISFYSKSYRKLKLEIFHDLFFNFSVVTRLSCRFTSFSYVHCNISHFVVFLSFLSDLLWFSFKYSFLGSVYAACQILLIFIGFKSYSI